MGYCEEIIEHVTLQAGIYIKWLLTNTVIGRQDK